MKKIIYHKLVRDRIPKRIEESGGVYQVRVLGKTEFRKELLKKVGEEASGLCAAKDRRGLISELGDVLDVLDEIKREFRIRAPELSASRRKEFARKGGFTKHLYLEWTSDTGYRSNEKA